MISRWIKIPVALIILTSLTACYRMPTENDYSLIPNTNNRDLTRDHPSTSAAPEISY